MMYKHSGEVESMCTVFLKRGGVKKYFGQFETKADAESFCEENDWEWLDGNEFLWDLDYEVL